MKKIKNIIMASFVLSMMSCNPILVSPVIVTDNPVGSKVGEASYRLNLLGLPSTKDANRGIAAAAKAGGITKIATVDFKYDIQNRSYHTIVTGE
jgi:hypothetical protein